MTVRTWTLAGVALATALVAFGSAAARAEDPARPPAARPSGAEATAPAAERARVRASHRVDVIAPGERIQTVIDRLRAARPPGGAGAVQGAPGDDRRRGDGSAPGRDGDARPPDGGGHAGTGGRDHPPEAPRAPGGERPGGGSSEHPHR